METSKLNVDLLAERNLRIAHSMRLCEFGISYLDDALGAIRPTELAIIAARTGAGKTQLASIIALHNASLGYRVSMIALEAEPLEVLRRLKYQTMARMFFDDRDKFPKEINLNYTDWLHERYGDKLEFLEHLADDKLKETLPNLNIYTPTFTQFCKNDLSTLYEIKQEGSRLMILDHLHYVAPDHKETEFDHMKKIMWQIRDQINKHEVPMVCMSHLRKETMGDKTLVPPLHSIHGSSEITKQANHVISLAPAHAVPSVNDPKKPLTTPPGSTFIRVLKTRSGHSSCERFIGMSIFDLKTQSYAKGYIPYRCDESGSLISNMRYQDFYSWMGLAKEPSA